MSQLIDIQPSPTRRTMPPLNQLGFGKYFTDHMFVMDYHKGKGWHHPRIMPYLPFSMGPSAAVFHYGQALFEGLKAYRTDDNKAMVFRLRDHAARMARSTNRIAMPPIDPEWIERGVTELVRIDRDWIPVGEQAALYLRPTLMATEEFLGVKPADSYRFFVIASPVGAYYGGSWDAVKIWVESEYVRAAPGGLGAVKAAANYAASLSASARAKSLGYSQVLWLDAIQRKYLEEVGTMNLFIRIGDELITPPLDGTILAGITRDTVITLAKEWGMTCHERRISMDEIHEAHKAGTLMEIFGSGTAAVITPVGELGYPGGSLTIAEGRVGEWSRRFFETITKIVRAQVDDGHGWLTEVV